MSETKVTEERLRQIMLKAVDCRAWLVALMIAKDLNDTAAMNKFADELVDVIKWHIPLVERTPEKLAAEKKRILVETVNF